MAINFAQEKERHIGDVLRNIQGAGKDLGSLNKYKAEAEQGGFYGGDIQKQYEANLQDATAQNQAQQAAAQRQVDVGNQKSALINQQGDQARRGLANNIVQSNRDMNKRGLLYGAQSAGARQDLRSDAAGEMAGYRSKVNQASDEQLGDLAEQSAGRGMQSYGAQIDQNQNQYADALKRYQQKKGMFSAVGEGLSKVGSLLPF